jgi:hypothetical protein
MLDFANDLFFLLFLGGKNVNTLVLGTSGGYISPGDQRSGVATSNTGSER